jgi:hypothetical protein
MARRRRRARKPGLVSTSQARGRTETLIPAMLPVLHNVLLPANGSTSNENVDPNLIVPRRSKREHEALQLRPYNRGTWSDKERLLFLSGMCVYGLGRWKEIGTILTSRYETMQRLGQESMYTDVAKRVTDVFDFASPYRLALSHCSFLICDQLSYPCIAFNFLLYLHYRSNRQIKSHGQKIALRISQGENVLEELDAVEASGVLQERPGRTSDTATTHVVRNPSTGSIAIASPQIQQADAHQHKTSSSAMRNERSSTESLSRGAEAATEAASVAWMLCELKSTKTTTTLEDSSAFVTPSVP